AVIEPVLERDEFARRWTIGIERGKAAELAQAQHWIDAEEQGLQDIDRQFAEGRETRAEEVGEAGEETCLLDLLGVEVPGRRKQGERGHLALAALRQSEREQSAHAIAEDSDRRAGQRHRRFERGFEAAGDVIR